MTSSPVHCRQLRRYAEGQEPYLDFIDHKDTQPDTVYGNGRGM
jgi:hypothetical protein